MVKKHFNFLRKCVLFPFCHNLKNCYLILLLILIFITFARVPLCWFYGTVENLFMTDPWMLEIWHVCDLIMVILRLFTWFFQSTMSFVISFILCESFNCFCWERYLIFLLFILFFFQSVHLVCTECCNGICFPFLSIRWFYEGMNCSILNMYAANYEYTNSNYSAWYCHTSAANVLSYFYSWNIFFFCLFLFRSVLMF